jgi:hypothetical protein
LFLSPDSKKSTLTKSGGGSCGAEISSAASESLMVIWSFHFLMEAGWGRGRGFEVEKRKKKQ